MSPLRSMIDVPPPWAATVDRALAPGETVQGWWESDLTEDLNFGACLTVLTDRRLLSWRQSPKNVLQTRPQTWLLSEELTLAFVEQNGLGRLSLRDEQARLASWRCTAGRAKSARDFSTLFEHQVRPGVGPAPTIEPPTVEPPRGGFRAFWRLARFARPHWPAAAAGFSLMLLSTAAGLVPPYLTMPLIDKVLIPRQSGQEVPFSLVWLYLGGLFCAAVLAWMLNWARIFVLARVSERIAAELRNQTYEHLHRLSLDFYGSKRTGDLMSRVGSDTDRINMFLSVSGLDFLADVLMIVMTAVILTSIHPQLALVTLIPFPFIALLIQSVRTKLRNGFDRGNRAWAELVSVLADTIPGIRVVKAFAQEQREVERFRRANRFVLQVNDQVNRVWSFFGPMISLLTETGLLVVWACGAAWVFQGTLTVGVLTGFVAFISRFYTRLESMSRLVASAQRASAAADRIFDILDREPHVAEPTDPIHPGRLEGRIELRQAVFHYGKRRILDGVDLTVAPGEMIGLVGPSGAGKSTLVNLVCRFFDLDAGELLIDGVDVRRFPLAEYRRNIGLVLQEPFLFYGTVAENIAYGLPHADHARIVAAARAARAHDFILKLPDGYDSMVGERGQSLSGGERQRISIARALLIDPRILLLDEATSSVDTETERDIQAALDTLIEGRTTLAIAHRLSTLRRANRLVVIDSGRVAEVGSHDDLLTRGGVYARLYHAQQELAAQLED